MGILLILFNFEGNFDNQQICFTFKQICLGRQKSNLQRENFFNRNFVAGNKYAKGAKMPTSKVNTYNFPLTVDTCTLLSHFLLPLLEISLSPTTT